MSQNCDLVTFLAPLGGSEITLQQIDFVDGGMSMMRVRIREGKRFTIFDLDPVTARQWGEAMAKWADGQPGAGRLPE